MKLLTAISKQSVFNNLFLHIRLDDEEKKTQALGKVVFEDAHAIDDAVTPAIELAPDNCQDLIDSLWRIGFRPSYFKTEKNAHLSAIFAALSADEFKPNISP